MCPTLFSGSTRVSLAFSARLNDAQSCREAIRRVHQAQSMHNAPPITILMQEYRPSELLRPKPSWLQEQAKLMTFVYLYQSLPVEEPLLLWFPSLWHDQAQAKFALDDCAKHMQLWGVIDEV